METYEDLPINDQLLFSVRNGDTTKVKECLEKGAKIHQGPEDALFLASKNRYNEIVRLLFDYGADPSTVINGESALFCILPKYCNIYDVIVPYLEGMCVGSRIKTVVELIRCGVNPDHKDKNGDTLLTKLIVKKDIVMVLTLIREGADGWIEDSYGNNAFDYSSCDDLYNDLIEFTETNPFSCNIKKSK